MRSALVIAALMLAACGQPASVGYPPEIQLNFRNACDAQSPPAGLCSCVWRRIEADVPPAELIALERLPINERAGHPLTEQIAGFTLACHAELQAEAEVEQTPAP
jgi:hypothetical protein